jgi:hypothetical protein
MIGDGSQRPDRPSPVAHDGLGGKVEHVPLRLHVDGERFLVRAPREGGWAYDWLSGPNAGYGFSSGGPSDMSELEHRQAIRSFLDMIDPASGYVGDSS